MKKRKVLGTLAILALVLWLAVSGVVAWKLTRRLGPPHPEPPLAFAWGHIESHRLATADHQEIGAWLVRGDRQKACVVLLHGIGATRGQMLQVMQWLAEAHYTALTITQRAHGDSTGEVNDCGWGARHDAVAAVEFLRKECPGQPIYLVGRSMGAATAVFAAKDLGTKVSGYLLEQPYKDLSSAVWNRVHHQLPIGLDWLAYAGLRLWAPVFLGVSPNEIAPYEHIKDIPQNVPIVFAAGSADRHAPLSEVTAIYDRVRLHAKLVVFQGAAHVSLDGYDPQLYRKSLFGLLEGK
jgi:uncharacterized protein